MSSLRARCDVMEILDIQESLFVPSCGTQADSVKRSNPIWTMPKAGRDERTKVFLSKKQPQDLIGKDSPGFPYTPKRQRELPKWGFGTAAARPPAKANKYNEPSNDLLGALPDSQAFKFTYSNCVFGNIPRDAPSNSPDFEGYPAGAISPGPQRYKPAQGARFGTGNATYCVRMGHAPVIDHIPPSYTMRKKTKILELESQTGVKVGPGLYPNPEACGMQHSSEKRSLPMWRINRHDRFGDNSRIRDAGRLWDGFKDQKEKNCRSYSSAPSFSFGTSTRGHQQKVARCTTKLDEGPSAFMDKPWKSHPEIATRKEIIKYTDVPAC